MAGEAGCEIGSLFEHPEIEHRITHAHQNFRVMETHPRCVFGPLLSASLYPCFMASQKCILSPHLPVPCLLFCAWTWFGFSKDLRIYMFARMGRAILPRAAAVCTGVAALVAFGACNHSSTTTLHDTTSPSAPSGLAAAAVSATLVNVTWTASTGNAPVSAYTLERCQGMGCSNFAQIATSSGTAFADSGLTSATSYSYRVRAEDASGNLSGYSNIASAMTQSSSDTTPPSTPASLLAIPFSSSQIHLSWTASTDNVALGGYEVERCQGAGCSNFAQTADLSDSVYDDTSLAASTSFTYRVRAFDAAGNLSDFSSSATATTNAGLSAAMPTLIQRKSDAGAGALSVTNWSVNLPNPSQGGNCLVVVAAAGNSFAGISVNDDKANTWNASTLVSDVTHNQALQIFYAANVLAGTQAITVHFQGGPSYSQGQRFEFANVLTATPLDGQSGQTTSGTSLRPGSFTTTMDATLITEAAPLDSYGTLSKPISWTPEPGFTLISPDNTSLIATQYQIQASRGVIDPSLGSSVNVTGAITKAIALKPASAGSIPSGGIRVKGINIQSVENGYLSNITETFTFQF